MKYTFQTDDDHEAVILMQAQKMSLAIWEFKEYLRSQRYHHDETTRDDSYGIATNFNDCMEGIDFDNGW